MLSNLSKVSQYIKDIYYFFLGTVFSRVFGFLTTIYLTRSLTNNDFAIYALFIRTTEYLSNFLRFGIGHSSQVLLAQEENKVRRLGIILAGIFLQLVMILILLFFYFFRADLSDLISQPELNDYAPFLVLALVGIASIYLFDHVLRGLGFFKYLSGVVAIISIIELIFLYFAIQLFGLNGAIIAATLTRLLTSAFFFTYLIKHFWHLSIFKELSIIFKSVIPIIKLAYPFGIIMFLQGTIGIYLLGLLTNYAPIEQVGYLRLVGAIGSILVMIPNSLVPVFITNVSKQNTEHSEGSIKFFNKNIIFTFYISILTIIMIYPLLEFFTFFAFGENFINLNQYFLLSCLLPFVTNLFNIVTSYLIGVKDMKWFCFIQVTALIVNSIFGYYLIPVIQLNGFLIAEASGFFIAFVVGFTYLNINKNVNEILTKVSKLVGGIFIVAGLIIIFSIFENLLWEVIFSTLISISLILYIYFFELSKKMRRKFNQFFLKR